MQAQIIMAYQAITGGKLNETVAVADIREYLLVATRGEVDEGIKELFRAGRAVVFPEDNTRKLTLRVEEGALVMSGEKKHYIKLER